MTDAAPLPWTVSRPSSRVLVCEMHARARPCEWEQWFLLRSDAHHDSIHCDRALEMRHLEEARERNAGIIDIGDLFDAMGGKRDPRADMSKIRPELREGPYFDRLVECAVERYGPFADRWLVMSPGNHEQTVTKNHEVNILERLVGALNATRGGAIQRMPYSFYIRFRVKRHARTKHGGRSKSLLYRGYHGSGGGGPVTRGVIQTNRRGVDTPSPDVIHTGHVHESWVVRVTQEIVTASDDTKLRRVSHVSTPGYKDEYSDGEGWHVERGAPPKPRGAAWLRLFFEWADNDHQLRYQIHEAEA